MNEEFTIVFVNSKGDITDLTGRDLVQLINVAVEYHFMKKVLEVRTHRMAA